MLWTIISAVAAVVSTITYILTAIYVRDQLKGQKADRYLHVTAELFTNWQDREFMEAQLWLIHRLQETEWKTFVARHRCDFGEIAFHRVGGFYDRVGTLVRLGFVNEQEILTTIGGHAIAIWSKIEPLVREARATETPSFSATSSGCCRPVTRVTSRGWRQVLASRPSRSSSPRTTSRSTSRRSSVGWVATNP